MIEKRMENSAWYPAIWKRLETRNFVPEKCQEISFNHEKYSSIDWSNVGPVLSCNRKLGSSDGIFLGETSSSAVQDERCKFIRTKNISNKFLLKKSLKFAYPLTNPNTIYKICNCEEKDNFLWHQGGNNLATFEIQGKPFIVYPEILKGKQGMVVSEIIPRIFEGLEQTSDKVFYCTKEHNKFLWDLKSETCQIIAKELNNKAYILSRSKNAIHYYSLREDLNSDAMMFIPYIKDCDIVTSATLSDTIPGYLATSVSSGIVYQYDISRSQNTKPVWEYNFSENDECAYQCEFGRHPLSLIVNNKSKIWLCDMRSKPTFGTGNKVQTLLSVKDMHSYVNRNDIICKVVQSGLHDSYILTSDSVLLMDERYCKLPKMKWDHKSASPSFATLCSIKDFEVLIFGSNTEFRLCSVYQDIKNQAGGQCVSGSPFHFNTVRDTLHFAHMQNIWFNIHADRIGNRISGIASCVNPSDESSLCLLTLNNSGDVFIQDFNIQNSDKFSASDNVILHDQIGKEMLQAWEKQVAELTLNEKNVQGSRKGKRERSRKRKKIFSNPNDSRGLWSVENYVLNKFSGEKFNFDLIVKDNLSSEEGLAKFLPEELSHCIKPSYFKNFRDKLSNSLVEVWEDQTKVEEEIGSHSVKYSRIPCEITHLSHLPKKLKAHHANNDTSFGPDFSFTTTQEKEEFSFLNTPKRANLEFLTPSSHPQKHSIKRSSKKRVDGF
ncbi:uncharacterized protein [Palaemon carinicauda]|uniref:uncharacterized protein isoform X2 n=1 Tax=Palaemon carinicauda TaxID=392227 RepID=UPI0035B62A5A